jgi:hypothetical protein
MALKMEVLALAALAVVVLRVAVVMVMVAEVSAFLVKAPMARGVCIQPILLAVAAVVLVEQTAIVAVVLVLTPLHFMVGAQEVLVVAQEAVVWGIQTTSLLCPATLIL